MIPHHVVALLLVAFSVTSAQAAGDPMAQLAAARSLKCHFGPGTETKWKGNTPAIAPARFDVDVQFDSIDLDKQSAHLVGNIGAGDIGVWNTAVGLTFIESKSSVLDVTTVFAAYTKNNEFPAVDSRHVNYVGTAMGEQFYGTCKVWQ